MPAQDTRIVIVGGGAGGLELATKLAHALRRKKAKVILVDKNATHFWKPRLHELAAGLVGAGEDEVSYLAQAKSHGFQFHLGEFGGIDVAQQRIRLQPVISATDGTEVLGAREITYDTLVLALGSCVNDFGVPGVLAHCNILDSAAQASALQQRLLESAVRTVTGALSRLRIVIIGAGATGVELAAEFHHAINAMGIYGGLSQAGTVDITLIDAASRVLPAVDPRMSERALKKLEKLEIDVRLGQGVRRVTEEAVHLNNGDIVTGEIIVWASGVRGADMSKLLPDFVLSKGSRLAVDETLRCTGKPNIFAMGDCAAVSIDGSGLLPPTAQVAHQQASYLAKSLARVLLGKPVKPFRFRALGTLVSLGEAGATGEIPLPKSAKGKMLLSSMIAKLFYAGLFHMHRVALHGWRKSLALFLADRLRRTALPPVKLH